MEGANEGTICCRLEEMPQLRRDVAQSTICYKDAYRGKGGYLIFGKDPSRNLPRHVHNGTLGGTSSQRDTCKWPSTSDGALESPGPRLLTGDVLGVQRAL
jgi:hypothetical protein